MKRTKSLLIVSIIFVFLMLFLSKTCYGFIIDVNVGEIQMKLDYSSASLSEADIAEIKESVNKYIEERQLKEDKELKEETLRKIKNKIELLIREKEEEKKRDTEKALLREMEKEFREKQNKIPNAGDTTILILNSITIVSAIALVVVIICSRKKKV